MFCPNCGGTVADDVRFCAHCGHALPVCQGTLPPQPVADAYAQQYQSHKNLLRQNETAILNRLIDYFSPKQGAYDAFENACRRVNHYARGARNALLIWGCIVSGMSLILLLGSILTYYDVRSDDAPLIMGIVGLILGAPMVTGGILMKVVNRRNFNKALQDYYRLSVELYSHFYACTDCPVGAEYTNPKILASILARVQSGRADTIKEAINLLVTPNQAKIYRFYNQTQQNTASIHAQTQIPVIFLNERLFR